MYKNILCLLLFYFGTWFSNCAQAVPITFDFEGEVTSTFFDSTNLFGPPDPFGGAIAFGSLINGSFTVESTTPDAIPHSSVGSYSNFGSPFGLVSTIGGINFSLSEFLNVSTANNIGLGVDQLSVLAQEGFPGGLTDFLSIQLLFEDLSGQALVDDTLPQTAKETGGFQSGIFFLEGVTNDLSTGDIFQFQIMGNVSLVTVPVPPTLWLLFAGLLCLVYLRMRRYLQLGKLLRDYSRVHLPLVF